MCVCVCVRHTHHQAGEKGQLRSVAADRQRERLAAAEDCKRGVRLEGERIVAVAPRGIARVEGAQEIGPLGAQLPPPRHQHLPSSPGR